MSYINSKRTIVLGFVVGVSALMAGTLWVIGFTNFTWSENEFGHNFSKNIGKIACGLHGGEWQGVSLGIDEWVCNFSTTDAGKVCRSSKECQGYCFVPNNIDEGAGESFNSLKSKPGRCSDKKYDKSDMVGYQLLP